RATTRGAQGRGCGGGAPERDGYRRVVGGAPRRLTRLANDLGDFAIACWDRYVFLGHALFVDADDFATKDLGAGSVPHDGTKRESEVVAEGPESAGGHAHRAVDLGGDACSRLVACGRRVLVLVAAVPRDHVFLAGLRADRRRSAAVGTERPPVERVIGL